MIVGTAVKYFYWYTCEMCSTVGFLSVTLINVLF